MVFVGSIFLALSAGWIGSVFTISAVPTWYRRLRKPSYNPPPKIFGPVWTLLYILMGTSAWMVWRVVEFASPLTWLWLYLGQLSLNTLWSILFFGLRKPALALVEVALLWLAILATLLSFWGISPLAGALLVPYLAWVSFASLLNFEIWRLNPDHSIAPRAT